MKKKRLDTQYCPYCHRKIQTQPPLRKNTCAMNCKGWRESSLKLDRLVRQRRGHPNAEN